MNDPRIYFAAERTLLAWVRTSISIMLLGFAVARFGIFLSMVDGHTPVHRHGPSVLFGLAMMGVALVVNVTAAWQFRAFRKSLPADQLSAAHGGGLATFTALCMAVACAWLAVYLW